jgi:hypothetical protein
LSRNNNSRTTSIQTSRKPVGSNESSLLEVKKVKGIFESIYPSPLHKFGRKGYP